MEVRATTVQTKSAQCECAVFGNGKKPLVILPGIFNKSLMPLAGAVADRYQKFLDGYKIYLLDRPLEPPQNCGAAFLAKAAAESLDALGVKGACVVGISAGGIAAQALAKSRPDLAAKLFLGSTCAKMTEAAAALIGNWADLAQEGKAADLNQAFAAAVYSQDFYQKYKDAIFASLDGATCADLKRFATLARAVLDFDATSLLPKIKCPILAVGAGLDKIFGADAAPQIARLAGNSSRSFVYQNYGHAVYDEAPDYVDRIYEFFEG
ncbi:MAG: alpha/beta hydrolase [Treponema sp.]|nr:alpha/beta hydrolase [Treponema sp.]